VIVNMHGKTTIKKIIKTISRKRHDIRNPTSVDKLGSAQHFTGKRN
jgi:hypothetical protein